MNLWDKELSLSSFWRTSINSIKSPTAFIEDTSPHGEYKNPILYVVANAEVVWLLSLLFLSPFIAFAFAIGFFDSKKMLTVLVVAIAGFIFYPLIVLPGMFLMSAFNHFILKLCEGNKNGFIATFRATCYFQAWMVVITFGQIFSLIPIIGGFLSLAFAFACMYFLSVFISKIHQTDLWRGLVAVLVPWAILTILLISLIIGLFMVGIYSHAGTQQNIDLNNTQSFQENSHQLTRTELRTIIAILQDIEMIRFGFQQCLAENPNLITTQMKISDLWNGAKAYIRPQPQGQEFFLGSSGFQYILKARNRNNGQKEMAILITNYNGQQVSFDLKEEINRRIERNEVSTLGGEDISKTGMVQFSDNYLAIIIHRF